MIDKIKIPNFKIFKNCEISFNSKRNILIGENGTGKSTILLAINCVLTGSHSMVSKLGLHTLFNQNVVSDFMSSDKKYENLPKVAVELF